NIAESVYGIGGCSGSDAWCKRNIGPMGLIGPILFHAPSFSPEQASAIARERYNLIAIAEELPSERDQNFLLKTINGDKFILKIANATEQRSLLEAQNDAMTHLASRLSLSSRVVLTQSGEAISIISTPTAEHYVRLITYIEGVPLAEVDQTPRLLFTF